MKETKFATLTIRHPHSGEISRSKIRTALIRDAYINGGREMSDAEIARRWRQANNGADIVRLEDVNYQIRVEAFHSELEY